MNLLQEISITNKENGKSAKVYFPCRDEELNAAAKAIGIEDVIPYASISILNVEESAIKYLDGMRVNLDELNYFYKRMESMTKQQALKIKVYADENRITNMKDMINLTFSESEFFLLSDFNDLNKLGKQIYLEKYGGMTRDEENSVDFVKLVEDTLLSGRTSITKHGVLTGDGSISEVYDGRLFPEYLYNSEETNLIVQISNQSGEEQHLYLPADITSVDKVKARLGVERIADCTMQICLHILPEKLMKQLEDIKTAEELTYLNEFCHAVKGFSNDEMLKLEMTAEAMNLREATKLTALSHCLKSFEVYPGVHDMEQYGKQAAMEMGNLREDSILLSFIDFKALGESQIKEQAAFYGFVEEGLVISNDNGMDIMKYRGEYAKYLEQPEGENLTLRLYSTLTATGYVNEDGAYNRVEYNGYELAEYEDEIREAVRKEFSPGEAARGLMTYFHESSEIAWKVTEARANVENYRDQLFGVLECKLREQLTEDEIKELIDFWSGQESDGWGEGFEQRKILVDDHEISVSFWNSDGYHFIKTEYELKGTVQEHEFINM